MTRITLFGLVILGTLGVLTRGGDAQASGDRTVDFTLTPTYGEVSLKPGFLPDPHEEPMTSGGSIDASYLSDRDPACRGHVAEAPDFQIWWSGTTDRLRVFFTPEADGGDTTLVINLPDGGWRCNDDAVGLNPEVEVASPPAGRYDVWVGSYHDGDSIQGTLGISELSR